MALDELLSRQIPHSIEAEQATLGAMLIDPDACNALYSARVIRSS